MATITPTALAEALGTDARTARKFLRSITPKDSHPGKGARWAIEKRDVRSLRTRFVKFQAEQEKARQERAENRAATAPADDATAPVTEQDESLDSLEGPTDDEIESLEN